MKKNTFNLVALFIFALLFTACNTKPAEETTQTYQCPMKCEGEKTYTQPTTCPVCGMKVVAIDEDKPILDDEISGESIFNLSSKWQTQNNETIDLKDLKGDILVITMIYTSCKEACPRLVADVRNIQQKIDNEAVKYVFVSIDPETDTPQRLKEFAIESEMDNNQWVFLHGNSEDVREFSNVLSVKYKQISPLDFSHSNIISVFNTEGELYYQEEGLGINNNLITQKINELL